MVAVAGYMVDPRDRLLLNSWRISIINSIKVIQMQHNFFIDKGNPPLPTQPKQWIHWLVTSRNNHHLPANVENMYKHILLLTLEAQILLAVAGKNEK